MENNEYIKGYNQALIDAARIVTENHKNCITTRQFDILSLTKESGVAGQLIDYLLANPEAHLSTKITMITSNTGCSEETAKQAIERFKTADWNWFKINFK